ncbi:MAG: nicotinate-nucleotide diphosphorylase (carboxylating) [Clostridiales bacterium GWF2_38_85]|nr:MAG: nicotinate-nucleotide diphosphorylase (carboxylating) [Clostridiales bacterium GWF2_38_85]HBL83818.1 carboxylating nicotinate-nucleotide diphosphorylase [Clostridiales bacterium]
MHIDQNQLDKIIRLSYDEDIGTGDITTNTTIPENTTASGSFIAKEDGVICGMGVASRCFELIDTTVKFEALVADGAKVKKGDVIAKISGNAASILVAERTALNLMQRMSGIATRTAEAVEQVKGTNAKITDTRKTMPMLRVLDKYAVRIGGGYNHRFNLADGILIKDNHIAAAGSITNAVSSAKNGAPHTLKVEVEVENFEQLNEALNAGADIIMLDNMTNEMMCEAVKLINGRVLLEASGNMGEKDLLAVAKTGVDIISIGALTHTVKALDISLKFKID